MSSRVEVYWLDQDRRYFVTPTSVISKVTNLHWPMEIYNRPLKIFKAVESNPSINIDNNTQHFTIEGTKFRRSSHDLHWRGIGRTGFEVSIPIQDNICHVRLSFLGLGSKDGLIFFIHVRFEAGEPCRPPTNSALSASTWRTAPSC